MIARKPRTLAAVLAAVVLLAGLAVGCTFTGGRSDAWEPLSEEELAYFNGDGFFNGDYLNIRNQFLSSTYAAPEEIDLFQLFYCGDGDADYAAPPDGVDPVALEAAMLAAEGGDAPDCPATILTTAQMDKVLEEYLGLTLAETGQVGLEHFTYLPGFDVYFYYHGDTNYRSSVAFTGGSGAASWCASPTTTPSWAADISRSPCGSAGRAGSSCPTWPFRPRSGFPWRAGWPPCRRSWRTRSWWWRKTTSSPIAPASWPPIITRRTTTPNGVDCSSRWGATARWALEQS
mgnify:CR=1 FL=1